MSQEAIHPTCVVCGGYADAGPSSRHDLHACSPCRAEHAGAVDLRLSADADPNVLGLRHLFNERRDFLPGKGTLNLLQVWGEALETTSRRVALLREILESGLSDAEAVAEALLTGGEMRFKLRRLGGGKFALYDLPAPLARRLAEKCPEIACGPTLADEELRRLAAAPDRRP